MKLSEERINAYKSKMTQTMEDVVKEHLTKCVPNFPENFDKFDRCMKHMEQAAADILDRKNGEIPNNVCLTICEDYYLEEMWKAEDAEEAKKKAEIEAKEAEKKAKEAEKKAKEAKKAEKERQEKAAKESQMDLFGGAVDEAKAEEPSQEQTKERELEEAEEEESEEEEAE